MKNYLYILFAFTLSAVGCSDSGDPVEIDLKDVPATISATVNNGPVSISEDGREIDVNFYSGGGEASIIIESGDNSWDIRGNAPSWLDLDREYTLLTISAPETDQVDPREATLTLYSGSAEITLKVRQRGSGSANIGVGSGTVRLTAGGQYPVEVTIEADNEDWTIDTDSDWLLVERDGYTLTFTPTANLAIQERETEVSINGVSANGETETEVIRVVQDAKSAIAFGEGASFYVDGGSRTIPVATNQDSFEIVNPTGEWYSAVKTDNGIILTVNANPGAGSRMAELEITTGELDNIATVGLSVNQTGTNPSLYILELEVPAANTEAALNVFGDIDGVIDWGDGTVEEVKISGQNRKHTYALKGNYFVSFEGTATQLYAGSGSSAWNFTAAQRGMVKEVKSWGKTGLTSMSNAFYSCQNLVKIPGDDNNVFNDVTDFSYAFYNCYNLAEIPADLFVNCTKTTSFSYVFYSVYSYDPKISTIPSGLFRNCVSALDMSSAFYGLINLKRVPGDLFAGCPNITTFASLFFRAGVEELPEELFHNNREAQIFTSAFAYLPIETIPENLFLYNDKATTFTSVFANTAVKAIPEGLFNGATAASVMGSCFNGCTGLTKVPAGLFANNQNITALNLAFSGCTSLVEVEPGVFDGLTRLTNIQSIFQNCRFTTVPSGLFAGCTAITSLNTVFQNNTALKSVPGDIFNLSASATSAQNLFNGCSSLEEVGEGLLDTFVNVTNLVGLFNGCASLRTVPPTIFDKCRRVVNFNNAFNGCAALTGEVPVTDGVKLYDRTAANGFANITNHTATFRNCTGLTDYNSIPDNWK